MFSQETKSHQTHAKKLELKFIIEGEMANTYSYFQATRNSSKVIISFSNDALIFKGDRRRLEDFAVAFTGQCGYILAGENSNGTLTINACFNDNVATKVSTQKATDFIKQLRNLEMITFHEQKRANEEIQKTNNTAPSKGYRR